MVIGIDIGGTKTLAANYQADGDLDQVVRFNTPSQLTEFLDELAQVIGQFQKKSDDQDIIISLAVPGVKRPGQSHIFAEFGNLDWHNVDLKSEIARRIKIDGIISDNDANVGALYEARNGAGRNFQKTVYVTISTGIGTGFTDNGEVIEYLSRSESGHMLFGDIIKQKVLPWQDYASGKALVGRYGTQASKTNDSDTWESFSYSLAIGLHNLAAIVQPDVIILGGSVSAYSDKFLPKIKNHFQRVRSKMVFIPEIVQASSPDKAVIKGCYLQAQGIIYERND